MKLPRMNSLLANDHAELDALADALVASLDGSDAQCIHRNLDYFWARLAMHIRAEHLHLFPALLRACRTLPAEAESGTSPKILESRIERLKDDHDFFMRELAAAVKQARELEARGGNATAGIL